MCLIFGGKKYVWQRHIFVFPGYDWHHGGQDKRVWRAGAGHDGGRWLGRLGQRQLGKGHP